MLDLPLFDLLHIEVNCFVVEPVRGAGVVSAVGDLQPGIIVKW